MPVLLFDHSEVLAGWAARQIPWVGEAGFGPCQAIGIASGYDDRDQLYAVIVFHEYQELAKTIEVSMAARTPRWCTPGVVRALLHYPFMQLGCYRLWGAIPSTNPRAIRFNLGIGMREDGRLRHHFGKKIHAVIVSMTRDEYLRSKWFVDVKARAREAA